MFKGKYSMNGGKKKKVNSQMFVPELQRKKTFLRLL